ncbi:MAG: DNA helicase II [Gammaproteobacteria bacterium TMED78]|nr:MAG: DNA helicase II [Gammaproteobacteria bacterium TMED78]|tara:strand:+ start:151143 stop:153299 length:2157 start_codon:yes stop_codon:yes gene_type:complete
MDTQRIISDLNDQQREAVTTNANSVLVLAGAGSGKTRVLVHRVAWLIVVEKIPPENLFIVTFTNKAALEMKKRIESILNYPTKNLWIGTFHGLSHKFLRINWDVARLNKNFQIIDSLDQLRIIKKTLKELNKGEKDFSPKEIQSYINRKKDNGVRANKIFSSEAENESEIIDIYKHYDHLCQSSSVVDFSELILRTVETLKENKELLEHYQNKFRYLLVDEFQDTNTIQYDFLRLMIGNNNSIFAVGDDDQSIYKWRGAKVENMQLFDKNFLSTKITRLEQNYRSTKNILSAANSIISNNSTRLGKELWTNANKGDLVSIFSASNERDEADFVINKISDYLNQGNLRSEIAILYRSNAQSRIFEEYLLKYKIPYRVYGGLRFFERAEVKDALAYLRIISNRSEDNSFERIVNVPPRGIGLKTIELIRKFSIKYNISLWNSSKKILGDNVLSKRANDALSSFIKLIEGMDSSTKDFLLSDKVRDVIRQSGLIDYYGREGQLNGEAKVENLEELVSASEGTILDDEESGLSPLDEFLSYAVLESGANQADSELDSVQLMTLHSAKGLEFPVIFLCGLEEGLFPHRRSINTESELEEERRLCYVGITRAKKTIYLTYAQQRRIYGIENFGAPSRFIGEIPNELIEDLNSITLHSNATFSNNEHKRKSSIQMHLGQRVFHDHFGEGVVLAYEGSGPQARVQVNFYNQGCKWLVLEYAKLKLI